ncbi:MAG: hypothetical protein NWT08_01485 [Akkermansiaceae bacterium]|jgi:hypothetical protein|nr:hypothetical protein [Akkermansiaceae bacterium]MDP4646015.1 hypothetical protein [Akkermansiaceae bacterium]MDP4721249.1 hypothetical protein [Akkermansiaceae bacterium]MDP4778727.1 hypothetical protein [Akkermansiaceae bacterium]MDP4846263.1 hypothetical protein [Akkermansiaceae bacterium]
MKKNCTLKAPLLSLALILSFPAAMGQEDLGILGKQEAPQKAPDWDEVEAVPLKASDLLGNWHGITVERTYYSVWEIEYKEDGSYKMTGFDRQFEFDEEEQYEDLTWDLTGKWKIGEDGILVCTDDADIEAEEEHKLGPLWLKPMKVEGDKLSYLTVYPQDEDASVAVIYEFKGKAPKILRDLPPFQPGAFKKAE